MPRYVLPGATETFPQKCGASVDAVRNDQRRSFLVVRLPRTAAAYRKTARERSAFDT
jgi:hypothetical protein